MKQWIYEIRWVFVYLALMGVVVVTAGWICSYLRDIVEKLSHIKISLGTLVRHVKRIENPIMGDVDEAQEDMIG